MAADLLARLIAASGVGYLAAAYAASRWLTRRSREAPSVPTDLADVCCDDLSCTTEDGIRLAGWAWTPARPRGTVALFHGMRGHRGYLAERVRFLTAAGYRCVAFDHRAHGRSGGRHISFGYHERRDVEAIIALIGRRWPDGPRAAIGVSMGAAALCYAGAASRFFQALVLESMYHDRASAFRCRVGSGLPAWYRHFIPGIIRVTERRLGARIEVMAPADRLRELAPRPLLLLTGSDDRHAPPEDLDRLSARSRGPCEVRVIPGAGHADVCEVGGPLYRDAVLGFLDRHLSAARLAA